MRYSISFTTRRPVSEIEDWLDENCSDEWAMRLDGVVNAGCIDRQLQLDLRFADLRDSQRFQQHFGSW
ncbi:MAG: hypothetical protein AB7G39_06825 [Alphaproteobacteria bacterium]